MKDPKLFESKILQEFWLAKPEFRIVICLSDKILNILTKSQLISEAIYGLLTSPKKQTDEFVLFAFLLFMTNKSNLSVRQLANLLFDFI